MLPGSRGLSGLIGEDLGSSLFLSPLVKPCLRQEPTEAVAIQDRAVILNLLRALNEVANRNR